MKLFRRRPPSPKRILARLDFDAKCDCQIAEVHCPRAAALSRRCKGCQSVTLACWRCHRITINMTLIGVVITCPTCKAKTARVGDSYDITRLERQR